MMSVDILAQLAAAADDLTNKGVINLQKLVEALIYSVIRTQARTYRRRDDATARAREVLDLVSQIPAETVAPSLREALEHSLKRYQVNPKGDLTYNEAPDVFVCRSCGHVSISEAPAECPVCGSSFGVFRRFQGMFNGDNCVPENPLALLNLLDQNAVQIESLVSDLRESDCIKHPFPGRWSIREQITHLYDAHVLLEGRVSLMLTENEPFLSSATPYARATESEGRPSSTSEILHMYKEARMAFTVRLRGMAPALLWRSGRHEDFGFVSIMHQVKYFTCHEQAHMGSVAALRRALV